MLYNDRKLKKWQGFMMSEQLGMLGQMREEGRQIEQQDELGLEEVAAGLHEAFTGRLKVRVQLGETREGLYGRDIEGTVEGFDHQQIYLGTREGLRAVALDEIRHVAVVPAVKWYE